MPDNSTHSTKSFEELEHKIAWSVTAFVQWDTSV